MRGPPANSPSAVHDHGSADGGSGGRQKARDAKPLGPSRKLDPRVLGRQATLASTVARHVRNQRLSAVNRSFGAHTSQRAGMTVSGDPAPSSPTPRRFAAIARRRGPPSVRFRRLEVCRAGPARPCPGSDTSGGAGNVGCQKARDAKTGPPSHDNRGMRKQEQRSVQQLCKPPRGASGVRHGGVRPAR